jgi:hypothetical protein
MFDIRKLVSGITSSVVDSVVGKTSSSEASALESALSAQTKQFQGVITSLQQETEKTFKNSEKNRKLDEAAYMARTQASKA